MVMYLSVEPLTPTARLPAAAPTIYKVSPALIEPQPTLEVCQAVATLVPSLAPAPVKLAYQFAGLVEDELELCDELLDLELEELEWLDEL